MSYQTGFTPLYAEFHLFRVYCQHKRDLVGYVLPYTSVVASTGLFKVSVLNCVTLL